MRLGKRIRSGKVGANLVIVLFLSLVLVDVFSVPGRLGIQLQSKVDPVVDCIGIWQGSWDLFAPSVDKENHRIVALLWLKDETAPRRLVSPNWIEMNCSELFFQSRKIEWYDRIRLGWNLPAQRSYAAYLKRDFETRHEGAMVERVELCVDARRISLSSKPLESEFHRFFSIDFQDD